MQPNMQLSKTTFIFKSDGIDYDVDCPHLTEKQTEQILKEEKLKNPCRSIEALTGKLNDILCRLSYDIYRNDRTRWSKTDWCTRRDKKCLVMQQIIQSRGAEWLGCRPFWFDCQRHEFKRVDLDASPILDKVLTNERVRRYQLIVSGEISDVTLIFKDEITNGEVKLYGVKALLIASSEYFRATFGKNATFREKTQDTLTLNIPLTVGMRMVLDCFWEKYTSQELEDVLLKLKEDELMEFADAASYLQAKGPMLVGCAVLMERNDIWRDASVAKLMWMLKLIQTCKVTQNQSLTNHVNLESFVEQFFSRWPDFYDKIISEELNMDSCLSLYQSVTALKERSLTVAVLKKIEIGLNRDNFASVCQFAIRWNTKELNEIIIQFMQVNGNEKWLRLEYKKACENDSLNSNDNSNPAIATWNAWQRIKNKK